MDMGVVNSEKTD